MSPPVDPVHANDPLPKRTDIVVVGGGVAGVATAYEIAKRGVSVALVEKGVIAGEQSSRNWGYCRQQGRDPVEIPLIMESMRIWRGLSEEIGEDTGFRTAGVGYLADDDAAMARYEKWADHAKTYQLDTRLLGPADVEGVAPGSVKKWRGGLFTPSDGKAEPGLAVPALARAARERGATLHQNCAARGIETKAGRVSHLVTEQGAIETDTVVIAGGAWSRLFLKRCGIELPQQVSISSAMRTKPYADVLTPSFSGPNFATRRRMDGGYTIAHGNAWNYDIIPDSFRLMRAFWPAYQTEKKAIRMRFGTRFFEAMRQERHRPLDAVSAFEENRIWDPAPDRSILDAAERNLKSAFPAFNGIEIAERWAGAIDVTPDAVPVIDHATSLPGLIISTGYSGHGFGIGPGAGRLTADLATNAAPVVDPTPFRLDRFQNGVRGPAEA